MINKILIFFIFFGFSISAIHAEVIDTAGMFSATAIESANKKIDEVKAKTGKVLVFETIDTLNGKDPKELSIENARAKKVNGVYVMIAKKEKKIEIRTGSNTRKLFGNTEARQFKEKIASGFKAGNFDMGLTNSVDYYYSVFSSADTNKAVVPPTPVTKQPVHRASSAASGGFSVLKILFILLVVFIIFRVISALFSRGSSQGPGYGGGGYGNSGYNSGGGMGFMGSFLTGMFGAMAGSWMYDKFFDDNSSSGTYANTNEDYNSSSGYDSSSSNSESSSWSSTDDYSDYSSGDSGSYDSDSSSSDSSSGDSDW